jgi:8-oxo-dGTP pyrophosphatase MutT (NUDIX family)
MREVLEETGVSVLVGSLEKVMSDLTRVGRRRRRMHTVRMIYKATLLSSAPSWSETSLLGHCRWLTPQECSALSLADFVAVVLSQAQEDFASDT